MKVFNNVITAQSSKITTYLATSEGIDINVKDEDCILIKDETLMSANPKFNLITGGQTFTGFTIYVLLDTSNPNPVNWNISVNGSSSSTINGNDGYLKIIRGGNEYTWNIDKYITQS